MFRGKVENRIGLRVTLKTKDQIEEVQKFFTDIQQYAWEATPLITKNIKVMNYPKEVREIIAENEKSGKIGKQLETPELKQK
jgi:hypothetical protein